MQTKKICLNGKWFFQAVESFDKKVYGFSVPSLWTHGECWGYPDSWSQVKQAWIWRKITIPDEWKNFRIVLKFEAVMLKAEVFLDNTKIGEHTGGFTPFEIDLSDIAKTFNKNSCELRVLVTSAKYAEQGQKLIHQIGYPENYEEGCLPGGIWQSIWLIALPQVHFGNWHYNSYISKNKLEFFIKIHNVSTQKFNGYVKCLFLNNQNKKFFPDKNIKITSGNKIAIKFNKPIDKLPLWSSSLPNLLKIIFVLIDSNGKLIHKLPVRIGLREFSIKQDKFLLNGKPIHLLGYSLIRHRVSPHWWREDYVRTIFRFIKKLGFNHIRTHAAICPEVILKVADEEGILIQDQSSLWSTGQSGYFLGGPTLLQNSKREFKEWIERDRNHPSVIIWDVENELIRINARNTSLVNELIDFVKTIDSTRPVVASGAGAHKHSDFYHQHCERGLTKIIDFWAKQHRNKPFVAGEWWADATKLSMNTTHFGVNNLKRYPAEFKSQDDIHRKFGQLYRDEIIAHRIRGVAGTVLFGMDSLFLNHGGQQKHI